MYFLLDLFWIDRRLCININNVEKMKKKRERERECVRVNVSDFDERYYSLYT
jgi:hypothetical protein